MRIAIKMRMAVKLTAVTLVLLAGSVQAETVTFAEGAFDIDFSTIGNPGNPDWRDGQPSAIGGVDYIYQISTYAVSVEMVNVYNADTRPIAGPAITTGSAYGTNRPAYGVSVNEAMRFVNWLNRDGGFQEAYKFTTDGGNDNLALWTPADAGYDANNPYRNSNARYVLPTNDEWYKAAFYDPNKDGGAGGYWTYAFGSDAVPMGTSGGTDPGTAVYRYFAGDGIPAEDAWPDPPAPAAIDNAGGLSPYGTMGQTGNYWERLESPWYNTGDFLPGTIRPILGGRWNDPHGALELRYFGLTFPPDDENSGVGFRVGTTVPEPGTMLLLTLGGLGVLRRRRRRVK